MGLNEDDEGCTEVEWGCTDDLDAVLEGSGVERVEVGPLMGIETSTELDVDTLLVDLPLDGDRLFRRVEGVLDVEPVECKLCVIEAELCVSTLEDREDV